MSATGGRARRTLAFGMLVASVLSVVGGLALFAAAGPRDDLLELDPNTVGGLGLGIAYGVTGWFIATRRPGNVNGWIMLVIAVTQALEFFASVSVLYGYRVAPGSVPFVDLLSWVAMWAWMPGFTLLITFQLLLFPDGRLPSRRWRPVAWLAGLALGLMIVPTALVSWPLRGEALLGDSTVASDAISLSSTLQQIGLLLAAIAAVLSVASVILRFRHAHGLERQQLKWFAWAVSITVAAVFAISFVSLPDIVAYPAAVLGTAVTPVAMGVAILRYRLFEIDRIVSRTLAWLVISVVLVAVFAAVILVLQAVLVPVTGGDTIAVATSTLVAAALFTPVRARVQRAVDRRFNRARYDADRTVARFAQRLRTGADLPTVSDGLGGVVREALAPATVSVWIKGGPFR
ncbi:MAG: hypothetical protein U0869_17080 [Chloroflexota bacterium]